MTAVNSQALYSSAYDIVFSVIDTRANIADPRDNTGARKFVYDAEPFVKALDFSNYPYIVVKMPLLTQDQASADNHYKFLGYTQTILVRTVKTGSGGSRSDAGHSDMQAIVDDLLETFNAVATRSSLHAQGIWNARIEVSSMDDTAVSSQQAIYETELELTYNFRKRVI
jgi:hypothetical protein